MLIYLNCSEFKEAFPAGRFRPVCKIQAKRGASSAAVADQIKPPEWWHSTRIIQAFDIVLADKVFQDELIRTLDINASSSSRNLRSCNESVYSARPNGRLS